MTMLQDALAIAARGWPVFPCDPKSKQPLVKGDRDPQTREIIPNTGGVKKASTDGHTIRAWWSHWPKAMIGIPTGHGINAFVVDIDAGADKDTGEVYEAAALQLALEQEIGEQLPATLFATTPRGGVHLYYALPEGAAPGNRANIIKRIDVRGEGGYVIAPPSLRSDGAAYQWRSPHTTPLSEAPAALLDLIFRRGRWADRRDEPEEGSIVARAAAKVKRPAGAGIAEVDQAVRKYALAALDAELAGVRDAAEGQRNDTLNVAALKIGQLVGAGAIAEGFARAALEDAAASCGLVGSDGLRSVRATIDSGMRKGKSQPRDLEEVRRAAATRSQRRPRDSAAGRISSSAAASSSASPRPPATTNGKPSSQTGASASNAAGEGAGGAQKPPRPRETEDQLNMRLAFFPLTDLGNAERFRERYRDRLKWCQAIGWLAWDGKRWSRDGADSLVMIAEHDTVRAIQLEADAVRESGLKEDGERGARDYVFDEKRDGTKIYYSDKIAAWGRASETANRLGALSKRGEPYFSVGIEKLDADPMKINVNNGTLVIRRREKGDDRDYVTFKPHDPDDLITKLAPVDYDKDATCDVYDAFLGRVQPSAEMRRFLHQWGGLSLTGDVSEQILAFLYGKGGNGKSVLVDVWGYVAGDYEETVPIETFIDHGKSRSAGQATPDLAILPGVRMLRTSEPEKNSKLAEAMVKLATGGEPIQARHLNKDFFKFYPQFKLTMSGNYRPTIVGTDEGIWRRVRLVPFDVSIPKEERDRHLAEKLRAEASGILNRLLDGLRDWCDVGLTEPEAITKATAEYRDVSDPLGRFLSMCVQASPGDRVQSSVLHQVYDAWCKSSGETAWKNRGFSMAMDERGFKRKQSDVVWWLDIKLIRSTNDFIDNEGNPVRVKPGDDAGEPVDAGSIEI